MGEYDDLPRIVVERRTGSVSSFLLGVLLGAGIALLLAPRTGRETRAGIREGALRLRRNAEDALRQVRDSVVDAMDEVREEIDERLEIARHAVEAGRRAARETRAAMERGLRETREALSERPSRPRSAGDDAGTAGDLSEESDAAS